MTNNFPGGERILGRLRSADSAGGVRIEDRVDATIHDVWAALTVPDQLVRWHGVVDGDLRPGGAFRRYLATDDVESTGSVDVCESPRQLRVTTRETDESYRKEQGAQPFDEITDITLTAVGDQTLLVIEVQGLPLAQIAFYGVGVQLHTERLAAYFVGQEPDDTQVRWNALLPTYQELAVTIG